MTKMTITFDDETMETLRAKAKAEGFARPAWMARFLIVKGLRGIGISGPDDEPSLIKLKNRREIEAYVEAKGLRLDLFIGNCVLSEMKRHALKGTQKEEFDRILKK
ncbi:hypothetical protein AGMMS49942_13110 [Spirochaetia bacterium]|nr:hypothetical protein AGMMS49942_13110 [Spirochaetia bacterium]